MIDDLVVVVDGTTWSTPAWPALVPAAAAVLALGLLFVAVLVPRRGAGLPWVAGGAALLTLFGAPVIAATPAFVWGPRGEEGAGPRAADLFGDLVIFDAVAAGATFLLLGAALAVWLFRPRAGGPPWLAAAAGTIAVGAALSGLGHGVWIRAVGALPGLGGELPPRIHVGREVSVPAALLGVDPAGWTLDAPPVRPTAPGPVAATIRASGHGFLGVRTVEAEAGEDRLAPELALRVGDTWIYEETTRWRNHYLWVVSAPGSAVGPRTVVKVTGMRDTPALRFYTVEVRDADGVKPHDIYAWNGAPLLHDADADPASEPVALLRYEGSEAADEDGLVACASGVLPGGCRCYRAPPGGPIALAGPARCEWTTGSAFSTGVSAFLAVVTVGLVLEDPNRSKKLELVASGRDLPVDVPADDVP